MKVFRQNECMEAKGLALILQDGDEDYSGEYELMSWDRVDRN